ncbi:MAG: OmpA family protein [Sedimenticola sp.]|nr:OmpA family protein [Sedimenticola sp.]
MNRVIIFPLIACMTWLGSVPIHAADYLNQDLGIEQWQGGSREKAAAVENYSQEWQGGGIGGIAGALLAGPPGLIVGAASGVLMGRNSALTSDLHTTRQEVEQLRKQSEQDASKLDVLAKQLAKAQDASQQQLQAVANGFIYRVQFRSKQSVLELHDQQALKALSKSLGKLSALNVHIHAFADQRGSAEENQLLSMARSEAVAHLLIAGGVAAERIESRAYGESSARYPRSDNEGMGFDRQVVIRFCLKENS